MPRKKEPTCVTEKYTFPTRLRKLMENRGITQKTLADAINMRPQTVSLYTTGQSSPDVNALKKIAEFFNVSADYLLGLTDVKKPDATIQAICEYTGFSENALSALHSLHIAVQTHDLQHLSGSLTELLKLAHIPNELDVLNYLLSSGSMQELLSGFVELWQRTISAQGSMEWPLVDYRIYEALPDGYAILSPSERSQVAHYELSINFERIVDRFILEKGR